MYKAAVYKECGEFKNDSFTIRKVSLEDVRALMKVYSDRQSIPLFNTDNCDGDTFCYDTEVKMREAVNFWLFSYEKGYFVRFSIVDNSTLEPVGTIELFNRFQADHFNNCAILRIDLRSDYEKKSVISGILSLIVPKIKGMLSSSFVATKAKDSAPERTEALLSFGFKKSDEVLIGNSGTEYTDYYELML